MRSALVTGLMLLAALPALADEPALVESLPGTCQAPLRIGISPYLAPDLLREAFGPFVRHVGQKLGLEVELIIPEHYADMLTLLRERRLDVAYLTPVLYVRARQADPSLRLLVADVWQGVSFYTGYLVVRRDSPIEGVEGLRGHRLALVDPSSASGWLLARRELHRRGLPVEQAFSEIVPAGDHSRAIQMLLDGRVDVAAVSSDTLGTARRSHLDTSRLRILLKTGTVPPDVLCAAASLPDDLVERLTTLLLNLNSRTPEGRAVLPRALRLNGWRPADPREYDDIEHLMAEEEPAP